jgi:hypothetical protein
MDMVRSGFEPSGTEPSGEALVLPPADRPALPPTADPVPSDRRPTCLGQWEPLAGAELLGRLRFTGRPRPAADPDRRRRLRTLLESGLGTDGGTDDRPDERPDGRTDERPDERPDGLAPLVITRGRLARILDGESASLSAEGTEPVPTTALACGALVDVLFRQLVTVGFIDDPVADGLSALAVDRRNHRLVDWIGGLSDPDRRELENEVRRQADDLARRWPRLEPGWFPRTGVRDRTGRRDGHPVRPGRPGRRTARRRPGLGGPGRRHLRGPPPDRPDGQAVHGAGGGAAQPGPALSGGHVLHEDG